MSLPWCVYVFTIWGAKICLDQLFFTAMGSAVFLQIYFKKNLLVKEMPDYLCPAFEEKQWIGSSVG